MSDEGSAGMTQFDVEAECPACGAAFKVPRIRRGSTESCPVCRYMVRVGGEGAGEEGAAGIQGPAGAEPMPSEPSEPAEGEWPRGQPEAAVTARATGNCIVCTRDDEQFNPLAVSPIIQEMTGAPAVDVRQQVVRGQGVLAEGMPAPQARDLAARLSGLQVPVFAVAEDAVPVVERRILFNRIDGAQDEALQVLTDNRGTVKSIPWLALLAAFCTQEHVVLGGPTELEKHTEVVAIGYRVASSHTAYRAARRPTASPIECTLLVRGTSGSVLSLRFAERKVRYTYLGPRQQSSCAQNFALFLGDLMRYGPLTFFPASTRAVAAGQRTKVAKLKDKRDYDRYLRWVLCCVAARAQGTQ